MIIDNNWKQVCERIFRPYNSSLTTLIIISIMATICISITLITTIILKSFPRLSEVQTGCLKSSDRLCASFKGKRRPPTCYFSLRSVSSFPSLFILHLTDATFLLMECYHHFHLCYPANFEHYFEHHILITIFIIANHLHKLTRWQKLIQNVMLTILFSSIVNSSHIPHL